MSRPVLEGRNPRPLKSRWRNCGSFASHDSCYPIAGRAAIAVCCPCLTDSFPPAIRAELKTRAAVEKALFATAMEATMHGIIYLIGLIVVIMAILSFFGLR